MDHFIGEQWTSHFGVLWTANFGLDSLEIIGEVMKNLPDEFRASHPEVARHQMAQMRDRLIYG